MASTSQDLLTYSQFVRHREKQDEELKREFTSIHNEFANVYNEFTNIHNKFANVHNEFANIRNELTQMRANFSELYILAKRSQAVSHNARLRNPFHLLDPIPAYHSNHGLVEPKYFPKNAKEFFRLRNPSSDSDQELLVDLVRFYDVQGYQAWALDSDTYSDGDHGPEPADQDISLEEATKKYPDKAVDVLAGIFGLDEDNFVSFTRANAFAHDSRPSTTVKRSTKLESVAERDAGRRAQWSKKPPNPPQPSDWVALAGSDGNYRQKSASKSSSGPQILWDPLPLQTRQPTLNHPHSSKSGRSGGEQTSQHGKTAEPCLGLGSSTNAPTPAPTVIFNKPWDFILPLFKARHFGNNDGSLNIDNPVLLPGRKLRLVFVVQATSGIPSLKDVLAFFDL